MNGISSNIVYIKSWDGVEIFNEDDPMFKIVLQGKIKSNKSEEYFKKKTRKGNVCLNIKKFKKVKNSKLIVKIEELAKQLNVETSVIRDKYKTHQLENYVSQRIAECREWKEIGLEERENQEIKDYWEENRERLLKSEKPQHVSRETTGLPRSLVVVPSGDNKGCYILLKTKGGKQEVGIGSFSRATLAVNVETGEKKIFRTALAEHIPQNEREAQKKYRDDRYFAAGDIVEYTGQWRERGMDRNPNKKDYLPFLSKKEKIGILMDYFPKGDLSTIIGLRRRDRPPEGKLLEMALHLAKGLVAGQKAGLVNYDLKVENMILDDDLMPKILDFGMAHPAGQPLEEFCGSLGYLAPEVLDMKIDGKELINTNQTEVWMAGIIFSLMFRGNDFFNYTFSKFDGENLEGFKKSELEAMVKECFPKWEDETHIDSVIAACLAFEPEKRPTPETLVERLKKCRVAQ